MQRIRLSIAPEDEFPQPAKAILRRRTGKRLPRLNLRIMPAISHEKLQALVPTVIAKLPDGSSELLIHRHDSKSVYVVEVANRKQAMLFIAGSHVLCDPQINVMVSEMAATREASHGPVRSLEIGERTTLPRHRDI